MEDEFLLTVTDCMLAFDCFLLVYLCENSVFCFLQNLQVYFLIHDFITKVMHASFMLSLQDMGDHGPHNFLSFVALGNV